ncbi:hypothetical protein HYV84_00255 [Candidatus Woesearchaeota archaeon]|nr:hypothetical protein [Candidatus Woesearchaeota archaeon]
MVKKHLVHHKLPKELDVVIAIFSAVIGVWLLAYLVFGSVQTVGRATALELYSFTSEWAWDEAKGSSGALITEETVGERFFPPDWDADKCSAGFGSPPDSAFWPVPDTCLVPGEGTQQLRSCAFSACIGKAREWKGRFISSGEKDNSLITACWKESCECCR